MRGGEVGEKREGDLGGKGGTCLASVLSGISHTKTNSWALAWRNTPRIRIYAEITQI